MGDDQVKNAAERVKGSIKEAIGMINGDPKIEAEGAAEKAAAKAQSQAETIRNKPADDQPKLPHPAPFKA